MISTKLLARQNLQLPQLLSNLSGFVPYFFRLQFCLDFRNEELLAILVMLGSGTTVACYVMSRNMGHEGVLTSSVVMLTTLFSSFTVTGWLYIFKNTWINLKKPRQNLFKRFCRWFFIELSIIIQFLQAPCLTRDLHFFISYFSQYSFRYSRYRGLFDG